MAQSVMVESTTHSTSNLTHNLHDTWNLWAHLPHDTSWDLKSYKKIMQLTTVEDGIAINRTLPDTLIKNCMLFLMRDGIQPIWEDEKNRSGGCFSYKIEVWKYLLYAIIGENIAKENAFLSSVNGITISPKKNFCIIKIWMSNCDHQNAQKISEIRGLSPHGCLFKKHNPEY